MTASDNFLTRIASWFAPAARAEEPKSTSAPAPEAAAGAATVGLDDPCPPYEKTDRDHERELLVMLHICC